MEAAAPLALLHRGHTPSGPWASLCAVPRGPLPEPSTANPISTEYSQKSRKSFCSRGFGSLMGGSRRVSWRGRDRGGAVCTRTETYRRKPETRPPGLLQRSGLLTQEGKAGPAAPGRLPGNPPAPWSAGKLCAGRDQPDLTTRKQVAAAPGLRPGVCRWAATGLREHQARGGVRWGGEQAGAGAAGRAWRVRQVTGESLETGVPALLTGQCPAVHVRARVCGLGYGKQLQVCIAPGRCVGPLRASGRGQAPTRR